MTDTIEKAAMPDELFVVLGADDPSNEFTAMRNNEYPESTVRYIRADLAPQWLDISTAPRDGTEILVYRPLAEKSGDKKVAIKKGVNYNNHCWDCTVPEGAEKVNFTDGACFPTKWQPLPQPPAQKE
jgi:hypothetical protein